MDHNPLTQAYEQLTALVAKLDSKKEEILRELQWYKGIDIDKLSREREDRNAEVDHVQTEMSSIEADIAGIARDIKETQSHVKRLFNPFHWFSKDNWFSAEQATLRHNLKELRKAVRARNSQRQSAAEAIARNNKRIDDLTSIIQKHRSFDSDEKEEELCELNSEMSRRREERKAVAIRKKNVDEALEPVVSQMAHLDQERKQAESMLSLASRMDRKLTEAMNSYERAMIHEQCERDLGDGSPRRVARKQEASMRRIERDYKKLQSRAATIGRKASRPIEAVIVDGNNMCYEGGDFVGLAPAKALAFELQKEFSVTVVFDSAIRRMLRCNDKEISSQFGGGTRVHIVASRQLADETILELASGNKHNYIISNDRFGEYRDKEAVRSRRMIRHEIVRNQVFVHDLGIRVDYGS